ncbi:protein MGARP [Phyllobates terribilis]|uniref:protein MGARP n=1 Tax=Phyllobates terribilis TaxID=111132 RepID=UPI003CCA7043
MHLCRNAWLKLAPVTQRGAAALLRTASARQMSSSVPGSSGEALPYYLLVGVALAGGGFYAYRTVSRDRARFNDRHEYINTQLKPAFEDYESKSDKVEANAVSETIEAAVEAAIEEAVAEEVTEQESVPSAAPEQESAPNAAPEQESAPDTALEQESAPNTTPEQESSPDAAPEQESAPDASPEQESTPDAAAEQESATVEQETTPIPPLEREQAGDEAASAPTEQEPAPSPEAASEQAEEPENIESVGETLEETSPVLEAGSDNIAAELASAAEDWSELTARKPEEADAENAPVAQESEEAVVSEEATASS